MQPEEKPAQPKTQSPPQSSTAVASESLQEMVHEMESQFNNVMSSPVFDGELKSSNAAEEEEERADAFGETPPLVDEDIVKTLDVPKWLSDERVVEQLEKSIKEQNLESEYECTIELFGLGTSTANSSNDSHLLITMKGTDTRQLGRARRALEDILITHLDNITPKTASRNAKTPHPPSLGRLLYSFALSAADNNPRWNDRNRHRTVQGRALVPLLTKNKIWMNIVELPKDDEGNYHGMFLAGRGGRWFELYREKFSCRVDIYGDFVKDGDADNDGASAMLCEPYVLVSSREGKSNVDNCLQFIEHRIRDHAERFGVSRDRDVEKLAEQRRMMRPKNHNRNGKSVEEKKGGQGRGRSGRNEKQEVQE